MLDYTNSLTDLYFKMDRVVGVTIDKLFVTLSWLLVKYPFSLVIRLFLLSSTSYLLTNMRKIFCVSLNQKMIIFANDFCIQLQCFFSCSDRILIRGNHLPISSKSNYFMSGLATH